MFVHTPSSPVETGEMMGDSVGVGGKDTKAEVRAGAALGEKLDFWLRSS